LVIGSWKFTPDRPYSAEAVNESLQILPDGNKIHRTTLTKVYRDSAGRTRREMVNEDGTVRSITISDPVAKVSYTLNPATKTATKGGSAVASVGPGGAITTARTAGGTAFTKHRGAECHRHADHDHDSGRPGGQRAGAEDHLGAVVLR